MIKEPPGEEKRGWYLDRSISVANIFSVVAAISVLVVMWSGLDKRVALLEQTSVTQREQADGLKRDIKEEIRTINSKLDKILETRR